MLRICSMHVRDQKQIQTLAENPEGKVTAPVLHRWVQMGEHGMKIEYEKMEWIEPSHDSCVQCGCL